MDQTGSSGEGPRGEETEGICHSVKAGTKMPSDGSNGRAGLAMTATGAFIEINFSGCFLRQGGGHWMSDAGKVA